MKTKRTTPMVAVLLGLLFCVQTASAFYNPTVGKWISRDPISEVGFRLLTETTRRVNKRKDILDYGFVVNSPLSYRDYLGLEAGQLVVSIPSGNHSTVNKPSGNISIPFISMPCGEPYSDIDYNRPFVGETRELGLGVAANVGGEEEAETIATISIDGWGDMPSEIYLSGRTVCAFQYKCAQCCACGSGNYTSRWKGADEYVRGQLFGRLKRDRTGQPQSDENGNWKYTDLKCEVDSHELERAKSDCKNTSAGKCSTHGIQAQLSSH